MSKLTTPYHFYNSLFLWLDGSDPYGNENASTPANGESISKWYDKSLFRNTFSATSGNEPTYDSLNKRVVFDGTQHMKRAMSNFNDGFGFQIIIVGALDYVAGDGTDVILSGTTADGTGDFSLVTEKFVDGGSPSTQIRGTFAYKNTSNSSVKAEQAADAGDNVDNIFEALISPNGSQVATDVNNSGGGIVVNATDGVFLENTELGLMISSSGAEANGHIYEVLMFARELSAVERNMMQGYLKHKYNLRDEVLLPGLMIGSGTAYNAARTIHPFISQAPLANTTVVAGDGGETVKTPDLFVGAHKENPRSPFTFVRLSLDKNNENSDATFGDGIEHRGGIKQYYFTQEEGGDLSRFVPLSFPCLATVSPTPVEIVPSKGVSLRGNLTITLNDFIRGDDTVSFFSKFLAQNPFYLGRRIELFEGYFSRQNTIDGDIDIINFFDGRKEYLIDSMHLNKGVLTIRAKDPFTLADELKSKVPIPTRFSLNTDITSTSSTPTVNLRFDGTTQNTANINNASFAAFETAFGAIDISSSGITSAAASSETDITVTANNHGFLEGNRLTLSGFGTGSDSSVNINESYSVFSATTNTFIVRKSGLTNSETFDKTSGRIRKNGFARSSEEIYEYAAIKTGSVGVDATIQLEIVARSQWGTLGSEHEAGDSVQSCLFFGDSPEVSNFKDAGKTVDDVAYELLVNQAGVPAAAINIESSLQYSWQDEKTNWLSSFRINNIFSEPKEVNQQLSQIGSMVGVNFWWDDSAGKIRMKAETPELDTSNFVTITDDEILFNTFNLINSEKERVSRVFYYHGIKDSTSDRDKPKNYRNLYVNVDADSESDAQYGKEAQKTIFAWAVRSASTATSISQRYLNRFKNTPITCTFQVDKSVDTVQTGDHFFLESKHILTALGTIKSKIEMQCLSVTFDPKKQINTIKAKTFRFTTALVGRVTANIDSLNSGGTNYTVGNTLTHSGTGMQVEVLTLGGSNAVATYKVLDYGASYQTGTVLTFTGGSGSGFKLNIVQGSFANDGTGLGTEASPYTGQRLIKSYIACDSPSFGGGSNTRPFITAIINAAGSGYTNANPATFTQASNEITIPSGNGTGLIVQIQVSGGSITGDVTVTSNPVTGSLASESSHKGFNVEEILNLVKNGQSNAKIKIQASSKMSTGGEPYLIV